MVLWSLPTPSRLLSFTQFESKSRVNPEKPAVEIRHPKSFSSLPPDVLIWIWEFIIGTGSVDVLQPLAEVNELFKMVVNMTLLRNLVFRSDVSMAHWLTYIINMGITDRCRKLTIANLPSALDDGFQWSCARGQTTFLSFLTAAPQIEELRLVDIPEDFLISTCSRLPPTNKLHIMNMGFAYNNVGSLRALKLPDLMHIHTLHLRLPGGGSGFETDDATPITLRHLRNLTVTSVQKISAHVTVYLEKCNFPELETLSFQAFVAGQNCEYFMIRMINSFHGLKKLTLRIQTQQYPLILPLISTVPADAIHVDWKSDEIYDSLVRWLDTPVEFKVNGSNQLWQLSRSLWELRFRRMAIVIPAGQSEPPLFRKFPEYPERFISCRVCRMEIRANVRLTPQAIHDYRMHLLRHTIDNVVAQARNRELDRLTLTDNQASENWVSEQSSRLPVERGE